MVPSHRPVGSADGPALFPVYGWDCLSSRRRRPVADLSDKVAAGVNPAANAMSVT